MEIVRHVALWVRRATWTATTVALLAVVALALFDAGRFSGGDREITVTPSEQPDLVARAVADAEATGLSCTSTPSLTASIVFERQDGTVSVVSFEEAWEAARSGAGWVRWYCTAVTS